MVNQRRTSAYFIPVARPKKKGGQLAERGEVLPSKIRFYVQEGLVEPAGQMPGGYNLFDEAEALERLRLIRQLQEKNRLTLGEIKGRLASS